MREKKEIQKFLLQFFFLTAVFLFAFSCKAEAQLRPPDPPRPVTIAATAQTLSFGAFYHGSLGGTVNVDPYGTRTASGDVVLLNMGYTFTAAHFTITANPGTPISLILQQNVTLSGSNGGSMTLDIKGTNPVTPFVTSAQYPVPTDLYIGGTITVGNSTSNPPGNYSGSFYITRINE